MDQPEITNIPERRRYEQIKQDYINLQNLSSQIRSNDLITPNPYVVKGPMVVTPIVNDWRYIYVGDQINKLGMDWVWMVDNTNSRPCYQQIVPLGNTLNTYSPVNSQIIVSPRIVDMSYALEYEDLPVWRRTYRGGYISIAGYKYCWNPLDDERGMYVPC